ncbi:hypothetical protein PMM47T1_01425 [Pseudomonas sp. M47T1]|uniref:DUF2780 domain-containing protein n=1 Tax=unclassified Pseudomonas TaxID=196821 RepID=UPI00026066EA|nr:DUF2780 domain-containing protein [Pseudomonas sp. M47T1]EIK98657.1 hypothetical protein PMM47T1_01425 [Pseudomonas sp. M47T1]
MNTMRAITLATLTALASSPVFAFNLNDAVNAASTIQGGNQGSSTAPQAANLLNTVGTQLKVTPEQAVGGTGAMLGLAKNKLSSSDYSQLAKQVPGIDKLAGANAVSGLGGLLGQSGGADKGTLDSALGNVKNTSDLNNAFGKLGMDSGMVGQFAPVILQYLGQQGVGGTLLKSLGGIWGVGG